MQALAGGAEAHARGSLEEACALLPDLSQDPSLVIGVVNQSARDPRDVVDIYASVASLWPAPRSDTALYLRALATVVALRTRRWREAARLAGDRGFIARPGFAIRTLPITNLRLRRWIYGRFHSGQETASVDKPPPP